MGGGSGGHERPPGDSGSESDDDEREPGFVPEPEPDEGSEEEKEENDSGPGGVPDSPPGGGAGSGGAPAGVPTGSPSGTGGDSGMADEEPPREDDGHEEGGDGDPQEGTEDHTDEDQTDSEEGDEAQDEPDNDEDEQEEEENRDEEDDYDEDCLIAEFTLLHSTNPEPLEDASKGDICTIQQREQAVCVVDSEERVIGSIAEPWVGTLNECLDEGHQYRAHILEIDGGKCEVFVTNKCLIDQDIVLSDPNTSVQSKISQGTTLAIEKENEGVLAVTVDGTEVGDIPYPWVELLSDCLDQGREYRAEVIEIEADHCRINVQNGSIDE